MSRAVASLGTALALSACNSETRVLEIERAVLTLPAGGSPAAVYMTVRNTSAIELQVVGVEVDGASGIALQSVTAHRMPTASATRGATTIMSSIAGVTIPARTSVRFAPGGYTVLVESLRTPRARGDSVRIVVRLSNAWSRSAMARVVQYADLDSALSLIPPATVATAMDTTPSEATGERLYKGNGCATCHGLAGDGTGPVGRTLVPPPRDFRVATAFRNGTTVEAIAQTLATGIPNGGAMPLYAHLTNSERRALALYIVSLRSSPLSPQATP